MKHIIGVFFFSFVVVFNAKGQDSLEIEKCDTCHSVRKATLFSALIPGAGQIYNHLAQPKGSKKAVWKVPLIYAALGGVTYSLISNQTEVMKLRREYTYRTETGLVNDYEAYDTQGLLLLQTQSASSRDLSILGLILVYAIQVADAAVEAHFVSFDVSEDLTFRIKPWSHQSSHVGLSMSLNFR
jgi:hypothetical protein